MSDILIFSDDPNLSLFEESSIKNGGTYWMASNLMGFLGYESMTSFKNAINKAKIACLNLNISIEENFIIEGGQGGQLDTKLSRFACYLVAMNADPRKPEVAKAQAYFVTMAESLRKYREEAENVLRVEVRGEITSRDTSLSGIAKSVWVTDFALFKNAGYRGMYNMNLSRLRAYKGIPANRTPLDFMGKTELAANLFRLTQTEEKIKNESIVGQSGSERAAEKVGKEVRKTMQKISGTAPEDLPIADDINVVRKEIKHTAKRLKKIDDPKKITKVKRPKDKS